MVTIHLPLNLIQLNTAFVMPLEIKKKEKEGLEGGELSRE